MKLRVKIKKKKKIYLLWIQQEVPQDEHFSLSQLNVNWKVSIGNWIETQFHLATCPVPFTPIFVDRK